MASYPNSVINWVDVQDNVDDVRAAHVNNLYSEVIALETDCNTHKSNANIHKQSSGTTQSGVTANAEGDTTSAIGNSSHAEGNGTTANGYSSHAEGTGTSANGDRSHSEGYYTVASGENGSHAEGAAVTASGDSSHAQGFNTIANGYLSHVMGQYNKVLAGNTDTYSGTADAFVIGNGSSESTLSNAFRVTFDGKTYGLSAFNSTGADYAEYFEWLDENINAEDRIGYFVTLDGEKIRKATSLDDYILGIVSANPSVIGDSYQDDWNRKYVTDDWGRIQYQNITVPATYITKHYNAEINNEGIVIKDSYDEQVIGIPEHIDYVPVINPEWNQNTPYIPREKRPEWSAIGMMGKLLVRDDGSCQLNGYCKPNDNGIATTSISGYRVIKRVSTNIILILIK